MACHFKFDSTIYFSVNILDMIDLNSLTVLFLWISIMKFLTCPSFSVCSDGFFGPNCRNNCSHCLHSLCNLVNGHCVEGCNANEYGPFCQAGLLDL